MTRWWEKAVCLTVVYVLTICTFGISASAYFDRGSVAVTVGETAVTVKQGQKLSVSVSVDPSKDDQLPGCGMAECPQICGEMGCFNEKGDCQCAGVEYKTYYADVAAKSSNAAVATASCSSGVLSIKGISPGKATITVKGSLRQYRDGAKTIDVTVTAADSAKSPQPVKPSASKGQKTQGASAAQEKNTSPAKQKATQTPKTSEPAKQQETAQPVKTAPVSPAVSGSDNSAASGDNQQQGQCDAQTSGTERNTLMGEKIKIFDIGNGTVTKSAFEEIAADQLKATFQKTDAQGTVLYSWTFKGEEISKPADMDMTIAVSKSAPSETAKLANGKNALYLTFAHEGELPGKASIYLRVGDQYPDGEALSLYYVNQQENTAQVVQKNLKAENGYVNFELEHCSAYFLSPDSVTGSLAKNVLPYIVIGIVVLCAAAAVIGIRRFQKKKMDDLQ